MQKFIDREEELRLLGGEWRVCLLYGRRRVGKTRLVKEFLKDKKSVYLLCVDAPIRANLLRFSKLLSEEFNVPGLRFESFEELFSFLSRRDVEYIAVDEFGYLVRRGALPEFQAIVDEILGDKKLILTGSTVSVFETGLLGTRSPLYGRADLILHLKPLRFPHLFEWFPSSSPDQLAMIYAVTGGVPRYLEFFRGENAPEEIKEAFFGPTLLFYDAKKILQEELREPDVYFSILKAMAEGKAKFGEICSSTGLKSSQLPYYLDVLKRLGVVRARKPVLTGKRRKTLYEIADYYFDFWFRFVYEFEEDIDSGFPEGALAEFERGFPTYMGRAFERMAEELVREGIFCPFCPEKVGKEWDGVEVNVVALSKEEAFLAEVKWGSVAESEARKLLRELREKAELLPLKGRKPRFGLIARRIEAKESLRREGYCVYDLEDLRRTRTRSALSGGIRAGH